MRQFFRSSWPYLLSGLMLTAVFVATRSHAGDQPPSDTDPNAAQSNPDLPVSADDEDPIPADDDPPPADLADEADVPLFGDANPWVFEANHADKWEQTSRSLAQKARSARQAKKTDEYEKLKADLNKVVRDHFDQLEGERRKQIETLEARLKTLRDVLKQRADHAQAIVDRRVKALLGETDALDWNPQSPGLVIPDRFNFEGTWLLSPEMSSKVLPEIQSGQGGAFGGQRQAFERYWQDLAPGARESSADIKGQADQARARAAEAREAAKANMVERYRKMKEAHQEMEERLKAAEKELNSVESE